MINDRPVSLVNLLNCSDTEHALLGSSQRFGVNMCFRNFNRKFVHFCTALLVMQTQYSDENSVRPSVRQTFGL